mgnify:CR=1 FL=1
MGVLHYGVNTFEMDDRLLSHLQLVIGVKLRRGENFFMGWRDAANGNAHRSVWVDNGVPIYFEYSGQREPDLNFTWAEQLVDAAAKSGGLVIMAEDVRLVADQSMADESLVDER